MNEINKQYSRDKNGNPKFDNCSIFKTQYNLHPDMYDYSGEREKNYLTKCSPMEKVYENRIKLVMEDLERNPSPVAAPPPSAPVTAPQENDEIVEDKGSIFGFNRDFKIKIQDGEITMTKNKKGNGLLFEYKDQKYLYKPVNNVGEQFFKIVDGDPVTIRGQEETDLKNATLFYEENRNADAITKINNAFPKRGGKRKSKKAKKSKKSKKAKKGTRKSKK